MNEEGQKEESASVSFIFPNIVAERGEIERVANTFAGEDVETFMNRFTENAKSAELTVMSEEMWSILENTDSYSIPEGNWEDVDNHAALGHPESARDWQKLKLKMENGESLDAPIICQKGGRLHLVSGNTRLMVARALGQVPKVLLINVDETD